MTSYTVNSASGQATKHWPQYLAGASAAGGAFAFGTALGWPSPAGDRIVGDFDLSRNQWDWVGSIITLGGAISCLPIGFFMKKFGRKWTMIALVVPFLIGWSLLIWAQGFWMLVIGRFFLGLAGGAFCISAPQYSAEIAEKEIRGIIGTFFQLLINGGILFVYLIGPDWVIADLRWVNIICASIAVLFGVVFFFMPESPVYLVIENRLEEAKKSYKWLRGDQYDPQHEIDELLEELAESERNKITFSEAFSMRSTKFAMVIGFGLATFQQMSGVNIVIFYATQIFGWAQIPLNEDVATIILGCINLGFTFVGAFLVDRLGRKILLLLSIIGMTCCTSALGAYFFVFPPPEEGEAAEPNDFGWLPVTSLGFFLVFFAIGYGPVVWLMIGEVYSKHVNATIGPFTGSYNWLLAWVITYTFGGIQERIGLGWTFWIFAIGSTVGIFFTFFVIPETKGKSMAEIQTMLNGDSVKNDTDVDKS